MGKIVNQSRRYLITQNNPRDYGIESTQALIEIANELKGLKYAVASAEVGLKNQTPHMHMLAVYENPKSWTTLKNKFPSADIEGVMGTLHQTRDYVLKQGKWENTEKEDTRIDGTQVEYGEMPADRVSADPSKEVLLDLIRDGLSDYEIITQFPEYMFDLSHIQRTRLLIKQTQYATTWRDVKVFYIHGRTGRGKSRFVMDGFGYCNVFRVTDSQHPWDTYQGEDIVAFEEFNSSFKLQDMLNYLDSYPLKLGARYSDKQACYTKVFIISNLPLSEQYKNIQKDEKDAYKAFLRRINGVFEFIGDNLVDVYAISPQTQKQEFLGTTDTIDLLKQTNDYFNNNVPLFCNNEPIYKDTLPMNVDNNNPLLKFSVGE